MTTQTPDLEYETRRAQQHWIGITLDQVPGLPHWPSVKHWTQNDLRNAIVRCHDALNAVRLYATEFTEHTTLDQLDPRSTQAISYATQLCDQLEAEVNFVEVDHMVYAK